MNEIPRAPSPSDAMFESARQSWQPSILKKRDNSSQDPHILGQRVVRKLDSTMRPSSIPPFEQLLPPERRSPSSELVSLSPFSQIEFSRTLTPLDFGNSTPERPSQEPTTTSSSYYFTPLEVIEEDVTMASAPPLDTDFSEL